MTDVPSRMPPLTISGPQRLGDFELWEAVDDSSPDPRDHVYSCVALCLRQWSPEWPALGGTRWVQSETDEPERWRQESRHQALELAMAMYIKNSLLRKAAAALDGEGSNPIYQWQGGKGVIWTPPGAGLTEHRLRCHGKLIEHLQGRYVGSKDKGVGTEQLRIIAEVTRHTIGLGCGRDTGEATAYGVLSGLEQAALETGLSGSPTDPLADLPVLVIGAGKVGLPLAQLLDERGARVLLFDPELAAAATAVEGWLNRQRAIGAAIDERHGVTLSKLLRAGRILPGEGEVDALLHPEVQVVSPNGGPTEWLSRPAAGSSLSRAELLASNARANGLLRLVLGAGNDQVSTTHEGEAARESTLTVLSEAGIEFVPDPLVSPGGVIAVSHERLPVWDAERVNGDATRIVRKSVEQVFRVARALGGTDAVTMYRAFEALVEEPQWT
ncbi:MAG TPA: hypothetical protein VF017_05605 [Thermoanaerobaculia bacterium]|nr:hypothetical protein [Thermoanaerobaculia bacterium]